MTIFKKKERKMTEEGRVNFQGIFLVPSNSVFLIAREDSMCFLLDIFGQLFLFLYLPGRFPCEKSLFALHILGEIMWHL